MVTVGVVVVAVGVGVVTVAGDMVAAIVGPNVTHQDTLLAVSIGASGGFPMLNIARLDCQAVSNFALLEFNCSKGTIGMDTLAVVGVIVTLV